MEKIYSSIIKKFCSKTERKILNDWTISHHKDSYFQDANMDEYNSGTRLTTRLYGKEEIDKYIDIINYPKEAYNIKNRIIAHFHLENYLHPQTFKDGIVSGIGFKNGSICNHIDPIYYEETHTLHCNIVTQIPDSGGVTLIEGIEHKVDNGDLLYYLVSKHNHEVTKIEGTTNRILWVFGFCIDDYKINQIFT